MSTARFRDVADVACDPSRSFVYEHGWQTWSPTGLYRATETSPRPRSEFGLVNGYRSDCPPPPTGFQGEGLLAIRTDQDESLLWSAPRPTEEVPSIRVRAEADRLVVSATGEVACRVAPNDAALWSLLEEWAERAGQRASVSIRTTPPVWCSWYAHGRDMTMGDIERDPGAMDRLNLPIEIVQLDEGYEGALGDWLRPREGFSPLREAARRIKDAGRAPGIWVAPFLVSAHSATLAAHWDWIIPGVTAGSVWGQELRVLDVTRADVTEHLTGVFQALEEMGFAYFKLDFLFAGALAGPRQGDASPIAAYRHGLELVRKAVSGDAVIVGCGAPLLPSIGLVDAMRVSPDTGTNDEPATEGASGQDPPPELWFPSVKIALSTGRARAYQHARLWVNDPDVLMLRPEAQRREDWARYVAACNGLVASGDALDALDALGLETTRRLLHPSLSRPVDWDPFASSYL